MGDNRAYHYAPDSRAERQEYATILDWIPEGCRVLDLGCGEGSLLQALIRKKKIQAEGMELSPSGVEVCRSRGLAVRQGRIDETLPWVDDSFDYAICNVTLQMVVYPERLLTEMARVARRQIVSFPNFGNLRNRLDLLFFGRMPRAMLFGHSWWNTGHIHQLSVKDFEEILPRVGLQALAQAYLGRLMIPAMGNLAPNLFSTLALFMTTRTSVAPPS